MLKKLIQATLLQLLFSFSGFIFPDDDIEEVVITGSYIGDEGANLTPTEIIQKEDYLNSKHHKHCRDKQILKFSIWIQFSGKHPRGHRSRHVFNYIAWTGSSFNAAVA